MSNADNTTQKTTLTQPTGKIFTTQTPDPKLPIELDFSETPTLLRVDADGKPDENGTSLMFSFDNETSGTILKDFYNIFNGETLPTFIVSGQILDAKSFFEALDGSLMPAAGEEAQSPTSGGSIVALLAQVFSESSILALEGVDSSRDLPEFSRISFSSFPESSVLFADNNPVTPVDLALNNLSVIMTDSDMQRIVLTTNNTDIEPYKAQDKAAFDADMTPGYFGKMETEVYGVPNGATLNVLSVEGKSGIPVTFKVVDENGDKIQLTLDQAVGENNIFEAIDQQGNVYFALKWDATANIFTMYQYHLFEALDKEKFGDNDTIDIDFNFVDASGKVVTTQASVNFNSIDDFVKYKLDGMYGDTLDVASNRDIEHVVVTGYDAMDADSKGKKNIINTGVGTDRVILTADDDAMDADHKGKNIINTGAGADRVILTADDDAMYAYNKGENIINTGTGADKIILTADDEVMEADHKGKNIINTGAGADRIILTVDDDEAMTVTNKGKNIINTGAGADRVILTADNDETMEAYSKGKNIINTGAGADKVTLDAVDDDAMEADSKGKNIINTGAGADKIILNADYDAMDADDKNSKNIINTGAGADTVILNADNTAMEADSKGKNIINTGAGADKVILNAGDSNNAMDADSKGKNIIDTGAGDDKLILTALDDEVMEADGKNSKNIITTGAGDDKVTLTAQGSVMSASNKGENIIDLGKGDDFLLIDGKIEGDGVNTVQLGKGDDLMRLQNSNFGTTEFNAQISGDGGLDILHLGTHVSYETVKDSIDNGSVKDFELFVYGGESDTLQGNTQGALLANLDGISKTRGKYLLSNDWTSTKNEFISNSITYVEFENTDGTKILIVKDYLALSYGIEGAVGDDTFKQAGLEIEGNALIDLKNGNDILATATLKSTASNARNEIFAGDGADKVILNAADDAMYAEHKGENTINAGDGTDTVRLTAADDVMYTEKNGKNIINAGDGADKIILTATDDVMDANSKGENIINAGDGADTVRLNADDVVMDAYEQDSKNIINAGAGADKIILESKTDDVMEADEGGKNVINTGDGADTVTLNGDDDVMDADDKNSQNIINTGAGADKVTLNAADDDAMEADEGGKNTINTGIGADTVTLDADSDAMYAYGKNSQNIINTGDGADTVTLNANSDAMDSSYGGKNIIDLGDGDDFLHIIGNFSGNGNTISSGSGNDFVKLDAANIDFNDVLVEDSDGLDILLAQNTTFDEIKEGLNNGDITGMDVIVYSGNNTALNGEKSAEDALDELGIDIVKDANSGDKLQLDASWTRHSTGDVPTGYDVYTNNVMQILVKTDSLI